MEYNEILPPTVSYDHFQGIEALQSRNGENAFEMELASFKRSLDRSHQCYAKRSREKDGLVRWR